MNSRIVDCYSVGNLSTCRVNLGTVQRLKFLQVETQQSVTMRKKSKKNINSGNTFHLGLLENYSHNMARHQHVVLKTIRNPGNVRSEEETAKIIVEGSKHVVDGGLQHEEIRTDRWNWHQTVSVTHSLNKHKRWQLPDIVRASIDNIKEEDQSEGIKTPTPINISLVERHTPRYGYSQNCWGYARIQNTCVSYHDSGLPNAHAYSKHKYSFEVDLKNKGLCNEQEKYEKSEYAQKAKKRRLNHNQHFRGVQRKSRPKEEAKNDQNNPALPAWVLNAHRPRNDGHDEDNHDATGVPSPTVHYEVCHPHKHIIGHSSYSSSVYFYRDSYWRDEKKAPKGMDREIKEYATSLIRDGIDSYDKPTDVFTTDTDVADMEDDPYYQDPKYAFTLDDYICETSNKNRTKTKKKKKKKIERSSDAPFSNSAMSRDISSKCYGKGEVMYCDKSQDLDEDVLSSSEYGSDFEMVPSPDLENHELDHTVTKPEFMYNKPSAVPVCLLRDDITPDSLFKSYGDSYMESNTVPRAFVIDVSDQVLDTLNQRNGLRYEKSRTLCLVFEESKHSILHSDGKLFRLHIEGDFDVLQAFQYVSLPSTNSSTSSSTEPSSMKCFVDSLTKLVCDTAAILEKIIQKEKKLPSCTKQNWNLIRSLQGWDTSTYSTTLAYKLLEEEAPTEQIYTKSKSPLPITRSFLRTLSQVDHLDHCDICYDGLVLEAAGTGQGPSPELEGLALAACQHWFCKACWRGHVAERINRGDIRIKCPAYDCDALVSPALIVLLLPLAYAHKHRAHVCDARLEMARGWRWCPRAGCGRVARVYRDEGGEMEHEDPDDLQVDVLCSCGERWCFGCQKDAHWPSSCAQGATYYKMVKQKGTGRESLEGVTFFVEVKKCPFCRHPIEKDGGCQHMHCGKCGRDFCWECLGAWSDHGSSLTCPKSHTTTMTMEIDHEKDIRLNEFYSRKALAVLKLRKSAQRSESRIKHIAFKVYRTQFSFEGYTPWMEVIEHADITQKLLQAWSFMLEALYIQEHVYVVLSNCSNRARKVLLTEFDRFCFIIDTLQEILLGTLRLKNLEHRVDYCVTQGQQCAEVLVPKVNLAQLKLKARKS